MSLEKLKAAVEAGLAYAKDNNKKVIAGRFYQEKYDCGCPLYYAYLAMTKVDGREENLPRFFAGFLGCHVNDVWSFIHGVDGYIEPLQTTTDHDFFAYGTSIRNRLGIISS